MAQYANANAIVPAREGLPVTKEVAELQGKQFHAIDVEAASRNYEKTFEEYNSLLKKRRFLIKHTLYNLETSRLCF